MKNELAIGEMYNVKHSRKGSFQLKVTKINNNWITGIIVSGRTHAEMEYNIAGVGEEVSLRSAFCSFQKI